MIKKFSNFEDSKITEAVSKNWTRAVDINAEEFNAKIESFEWVKNDDAPKFFRSKDYRGDFQYMVPKNSKRVLTTMSDIVNNISSWNSYPSRKSSLIMSGGYPGFGANGDVYEIYPVPGATIAICPGIDFNKPGAFPVLKSKLGIDETFGFAEIIEVSTSLLKLRTSINVITNLSTIFDYINNGNSLNKLEAVESYYSTIKKMYKMYESCGRDFQKFLQSIMGPDENGFLQKKIEDISAAEVYGKECWTMDECLLKFVVK